jgi:phage repressor protein C with HTH and peptisase S24 domain
MGPVTFIKRKKWDASGSDFTFSIVNHHTMPRTRQNPIVDTPLARNLEALMVAAGYSQKRLALEAGLKETAVRDILQGVSKNPKIDTLRAIADRLGVPVSSFTGEELPVEDPGDMPTGADLVPVYGYAAGSDGDVITLNAGEIMERAPRHANQSDARSAFAIRVRGSSMEPRYWQGELVYCVRKRPPKPGEDCVVELEGGEAFLKTYRQQTASELVCEQWNPNQPWKAPKAKVKALHAVVGRG